MKRTYFSLLLVLFLTLFISGCAFMSQNTKFVELESKIDKLQQRMQEIEKEQTQLKEIVSNQAELQKDIMNKFASLKQSDIEKNISELPSEKDIQIALKNAGFYDGEIDGKIGSKTRDAIMEFQKQNGLEVDGVVGRNTWQILSKFYVSETND